MSRARDRLRLLYGSARPGRRGDEEYTVKYMLLIYNNPALYESWSPDDQAALGAEVEAIMKELRESGEFVRGEALAGAASARTVRIRENATAVTDGPFAQSKEQLAGYLTVECATPERAVEIAARWPDAKYFAMEVREIIHSEG